MGAGGTRPGVDGDGDIGQRFGRGCGFHGGEGHGNHVYRRRTSSCLCR